MTHDSHIALIEHELDGFHQSLAEYRQQMGAWYARALDSASHAADMPSLLGMERVLQCRRRKTSKAIRYVKKTYSTQSIFLLNSLLAGHLF